MRRDRRCRMNDNAEPGTPDFSKVTFIDEKKLNKSTRKATEDEIKRPDKKGEKGYDKG